MDRIIFVDDNEADQLMLRRALRPVAGEWETRFVSDARGALKAMEQSSFDVVVSDVQMPEMDGVKLLETVKRRHPGLVRIVLSGAEDSRAKLRALDSAHVWMTKPCDTDVLRDIVDRVHKWGHLLGDEHLKRLVGQMDALPSSHDVCCHIEEELRSPTASVRTIARLMLKDVGMTAKILHVANSGIVGTYSRISNPDYAVGALSPRMIRSLAISASVLSGVDTMKDKRLSAKDLVSHAFSTGALAREIAKTVTHDATVIEDAFLAGILHDVGKLVLASNLPRLYASAITLGRERGLPLLRAEEEIFGVNHTKVGAYLLALWGMPGPVVEACAHHHNPCACQEREFSALAAVHVANVVAHKQEERTADSISYLFDYDYLARLKANAWFEEWLEACLMPAGK